MFEPRLATPDKIIQTICDSGYDVAPAAMASSSVSVVANSLRLRRFKLRS